MSALFRWPCSISIQCVSQVCRCWCPPFSVGQVAILFICLPCYIGVLHSFLRWVRPLCHCWCPPFSAGHVAFLRICSCWCLPGDATFLFICLPGLSLVFLFICLPGLWWCLPFSAGDVACPFIACHCCCPPFSLGHVAFLCICLPNLSLVSAVSGGVRPFSAGHVAFLFICLRGVLLLVSALFRCPCSMSIHLSPRSVTAGAAFLLICLSVDFCISPNRLLLRGRKCFLRVSALLPDRESAFLGLPSCWSLCPPSCWSLCPPCLPSVSFCLPSCLPCVRLVSLHSLCVSFCLPSCGSLCPSCLHSVSFCFPS